MAKLREASTSVIRKSKKTRPGVHSKKKSSQLKSSKNYKKLNVGQGR